MIKCSFCGRTDEQVDRILEGPDNIFICEHCVDACNNALRVAKYILDKNVEQKEDVEDFLNILTPKEIVEKLNEYVISQDKAKKVLAVNVYNHYKKLKLAADNVHIQKSNLLLLGPTGTGKTYLLKTISKLLNVPFMAVDTTHLTPRGYRGGDLNDVWSRLFYKCAEEGKPVQQAIYKMQKAIIYFDEIDKILPHMNSEQSASAEFYGMIQSELLKILEDSEIAFTIKNGQMEREITIDSSNMLFIFGGAFSGIESIIEKRLGLNKKQAIGFGSSTVTSNENKSELIKQIDLKDLIEYGLMPEFVGRISNIVNLNPLTETDLVNILTNSKDSLVEQYKELFLVDGVKLDFEEKALKYIANQAIKKETGARGLKSIIETSMIDLMYEIPSDKTINTCLITEDFISGNGDAIITRQNSSSKNVYKLFN